MPKGVKECPKCELIVGAKASKCHCGFHFSTRTKHRKRKQSNEAILKHVLKKIRGNDYREHLSEHHRATTDSRKVKIILEIIFDTVHTRPLYINGHFIHVLIKKINKEIGCGTVNSFKKNILIDMDRMGYIDRLDEDGNPVSGKRGRGSTVSDIVLTKSGLDLAKVKAVNILRREQIHSGASIKLLGRDYVNAMLVIMDFVRYLSVKEFMYFVSGSSEYDLSKIIQNIKRYRTLSEAEQLHIDYMIEDEIEAINDKASNKTERRDLLSWQNEVTQICENLKNIPGFNFSNKVLTK